MDRTGLILLWFLFSSLDDFSLYKYVFAPAPAAFTTAPISCQPRTVRALEKHMRSLFPPSLITDGDDRRVTSIPPFSIGSIAVNAREIYFRKHSSTDDDRPKSKRAERKWGYVELYSSLQSDSTRTEDWDIPFVPSESRLEPNREKYLSIPLGFATVADGQPKSGVLPRFLRRFPRQALQTGHPQARRLSDIITHFTL